jgi:hypothetical protein
MTATGLTKATQQIVAERHRRCLTMTEHRSWTTASLACYQTLQPRGFHESRNWHVIRLSTTLSFIDGKRGQSLECNAADVFTCAT